MPACGSGRLVSAAVSLHHKTGATARNVCDHGRSPMQFCHDAKADSESELHGLPGAQAQIARLDEDAARAEVLRAAQTPLLSRQ
jgi:hypothetical protein